ncbi:amidohydrolase family protein [Thermopolyspora sp. NPDC052614]|uniref:amidohydrolase family protein n=1 Tax=Thermopolyspora sp. NPDC052614 TaxID=3155682 RepID=UPI00342F44CA
MTTARTRHRVASGAGGRGSAGVVVHSAPLMLPVAGPPLREGALAVRRGRVLAAGPRREVAGAFREHREVRWDGVVVAGLVNAHTHLQFSCLARLGRRRYGSLEEWSTAFDAAYAEASSAPDALATGRRRGRKVDWAAAARKGARAAIASGTTAVADVVTDMEAAAAYAEAGLTGMAYLEVLGDTEESWHAEGRERLITALQEAGLPMGVSPHAVYALDVAVLEDLALLARSYRVRQQIHLAESAHEREYTVRGTGPLARMVRDLGFDFAVLREGGTGLGPVDLLDGMGVFGEHCHVAHAVYLTPDERRVLRKRGTVIALCPRSNRTLGLDTPQVAALLEEGNPIAVGTDSLASSPSMDLLEDVRLLRDLAREQGYTDADLERRLVGAATEGGARALGMASGPGRIGALIPGARADFAVFDIDTGTREPYRTLIEEGPGRCAATVIAGRRVWQRARS